MRNRHIKSNNIRNRNGIISINDADLQSVARFISASLREGLRLFENESDNKSDISDIISIIDNPNQSDEDLSKILDFAKTRMLTPSGNTNFDTAKELAKLSEDKFENFKTALSKSFENKFKEFKAQKGRTKEAQALKLEEVYKSVRTAMEMVQAEKVNIAATSPSIPSELSSAPVEKKKKSSQSTQDVTASVKVFSALEKPEIKGKFVEIIEKINQLTHPGSKNARASAQKMISAFITTLDPEKDIPLRRLSEIDKFVNKSLEDQEKFAKSQADKDALISQKMDDPFAPKSKPGIMSSLKSLFKIRSENFDMSEDVIAEEIVRIMIKERHITTKSAALRSHRLIREMLEDHQQDHMEHMGPSENGVFDAPDEEHPGYMLLGNLKRLASKSAELASLASPWDDAEPWIESKVNSAAEHIDAIHDYIMYSVLDQDFDAVEHEQMMYECGEMAGDVMIGDEMMDDVLLEPHARGRHFGDGGSAQMARGQLFLIAKKAQSLSDRLSDDDTLPEWLQSKVTMAYQTIAMVSDYMEYKMNYQDSPHAV
jgi:hypothetical protein